MKFNCSCGAVQGEVSYPEYLYGLRFTCMCKDCQAYARFLENAERILDANAATEVVPVFPRFLTFTEGFQHVRGIKLREKSGTFRWFASCCRSPLANSLNSKAGYIGLNTQRLSDEERKSLGPICVRAHGESGIPPLPSGTSQRFPLKWIFVTFSQIIKMYAKGAKRPNPFFDDKDIPRAPLDVLNP